MQDARRRRQVNFARIVKFSQYSEIFARIAKFLLCSAISLHSEISLC